MLSLADLSFTETSLSVSSNFGKFFPCYFSNETLFYSNEGTLFRYASNDQKILILSIDEEEYKIKALD